jgi:hypothetical protein
MNSDGTDKIKVVRSGYWNSIGSAPVLHPMTDSKKGGSLMASHLPDKPAVMAGREYNESRFHQ